MKVVAEHLGRTGLEPHQASAQAQQGRLAGSVGALEQDDLPWADIEVDSGEGREPA